MGTEKARLTLAQAEAVNELLEDKNHEDAVLILADYKKQKKEFFVNQSLMPLNEITIDQFCRAIYCGIEIIEPPQEITVDEHMRAILLRFYESEVFTERGAGINAGIEFALKTLGIKVVGITE